MVLGRECQRRTNCASTKSRNVIAARRLSRDRISNTPWVSNTTAFVVTSHQRPAFA